MESREIEEGKIKKREYNKRVEGTGKDRRRKLVRVRVIEVGLGLMEGRQKGDQGQAGGSSCASTDPPGLSFAPIILTRSEAKSSC